MYLSNNTINNNKITITCISIVIQSMVILGTVPNMGWTR